MSERETSRFVKADGLSLHYNEIGDPSGQPIIWIHGGGPGASALSNYARNMSGFAAYRNLLFDMPQFGKSDKPVINEPRLEFNARHVVAALDELGIDKAHFIGNSMGGGTSTKVAIDAPAKVDRLILMGAAGTGLPDGEPPKGIRLLMSYFQDGGSREKMDELARTFVYDDSSLTDELIQSRYEASLDPEIHDAQKKSAPMVLEDLTNDLAKVQAPTLLLWGREDLFVALESAAAYLRGIPDARLFVAPKCGHWFQWEHVELFNRMVTDFLRGELDE